MGKKTLTSADRARIQKAAAERRNAKETRQMIILSVALPAVIAVVAIVVAAVNASTLPAEIRDLSAIQDNWIVIDTDNTVRKRYHHPASFDVPAGYTLDEFDTSNDVNQRSFLVVADSEDAVVEQVHVSAAANWTAEQYIGNVLANCTSIVNEGFTCTPGEPFEATIAGKAAKCLYLRYNGINEAGEAVGYGCLYIGFDAPRNVGVYAIVSGAYTTPDKVQTTEVLLAESETLLAGLTIVE